MRPFLCAAVLIMALYAMAPAQGDFQSNPAEGLKIATIYYQNGEYAEAFRKFSFLAEKFPSDSHASIFSFMAAKSLYKSGDYKNAIARWDEYQVSFPTSNLLPEVHLFKGHTYFEQGELEKASGEYIGVIDAFPKSEAAKVARENLEPLLRKGLSLKQVRQVLAEHPSSAMAESMELTLAKREMEAGHYRKASSALKAFMSNHPGSKEFKQARLLLQEAMEKSENEIVIGLLAPISGSWQDYGRSMAEGARLAIDIFRSDGFSVDLAIRDTEGDPILAAKVAKTLADEEPIAVVGPLRSESALSAAIVLNDRDIPMITPTASETGLSGIGPNIFQISPSIELIGEALARYAVKNLKIEEFAIISPDDEGGLKISKAFAEAVYKLGGEVVMTSYYTSDATDFKGQIMPLRDVLLEKTDELLSRGKLDSGQFVDVKTGHMLPREEWPVKLGGLFLPGYAEDLKLIIPQVRYHVIRTRMLGSDSWDSEELMREVKRYLDDAVFATDFHIDPKDSGWTRFSKAYVSAYNHQPDKVAALTYDSVRMVLEGIRKGNKTPEDLRGYLDKIDGYQGVTGTITFKENERANNGVTILSIDGKRLEKSN